MKKLAFILFFAFFIAFSLLYAQTPVSLEVTNRLTAAETPQGYCFAFQYENRFEFVNVIEGRDKRYEVIRLRESPDTNIEDFFIVGNKYF
jgi:hypothetical protein